MRKHPKFNVPNYGRKKRVKARWRKPRGTDNKKKIHKKIMGASPSIGWRSPRDDRGFHPSGLMEILIRNVNELDGAKGVAVRISAKIGAKKRAVIMEKAKKLGLPVLNPFKTS